MSHNTNTSGMRAGIDYIGVAVGALITDGSGRIFLTKRGKHATNERGTWEIPGGKVHFGETLEDAVRREIREEYGVEIELVYQFPAQDHILPDEGQHWVPTCFLARIVGGEPVIREPDKCDGIGWFALEALPEPLSVITALDIEAYRIYLAGSSPDMV